MFATLPRKSLLLTLHAFKAIVPRGKKGKPTMPILSTVRLTADGNNVTIDGTDLDVCATVTLAAFEARPGAVCVDRAALHAALKSMAGDTVTIKAIDLAVSVECGDARVDLPTLNAAEYPCLPKTLVGGNVVTLARDAAKHIDRIVRRAVCVDETRYVLNGIYFDDGNAIATDGHRLHMCASTLPKDARCIVPAKGWDAFLAFMPSGQMQTTETHVQFSAGPVRVIARLIDGRFPDYRQVLPKRGASAGESQGTMAARALASAFAPHVAIRQKDNATTRCHLNGKLALSTHSFDHGKADNALDCERAGGDATWGVNALYMRDALACFDGDVTLRVQLTMTKPGFADENKPPVIEMLDPIDLIDASGGDARCVVMPMRI